MISRQAYELVEVISKQYGLINIEMTSEQVLNWYKHLCEEYYNNKGNNRLSEEDKKEIIDLNGLGYDPKWIASKTGHARNSISRVLYESSTDNLMSRVKRMLYIEVMNGSISPYDTRPLEDVRARIEADKGIEEDLKSINERQKDYESGKYKNLRSIIAEW